METIKEWTEEVWSILWINWHRKGRCIHNYYKAILIMCLLFLYDLREILTKSFTKIRWLKCNTKWFGRHLLLEIVLQIAKLSLNLKLKEVRHHYVVKICRKTKRKKRLTKISWSLQSWWFLIHFQFKSRSHHKMRARNPS